MPHRLQQLDLVLLGLADNAAGGALELGISGDAVVPDDPAVEIPAAGCLLLGDAAVAPAGDPELLLDLRLLAVVG